MRYYMMTVIVRDDGIGDSGSEEYLSEETLVETLEINQAAGIDSKVVSVMECAGPVVTVFNCQAEDKFMVDYAAKYGQFTFGLSGRQVKLEEVFHEHDELATA